MTAGAFASPVLRLPKIHLKDSLFLSRLYPYDPCGSSTLCQTPGAGHGLQDTQNNEDFRCVLFDNRHDVLILTN